MTLTAVPFALQNGSHGAQLFREAVSSLISPAGGVIGLDDLFVSQNGTPNMSVNVDPGRCWVPGTSLATITPQTGNTYYPQGLYYAENDAAVNVPISASSPSLPRIDQIIVQIQDSAYTGSTNSASLVPLTGTPTSGAALNNLVGLASIPVSSMLVAYVLVPANATSIVTADLQYVATSAMAQLPLYTAGWAAPSLVGGWANVGGSDTLAGYRKQGDLVQLRGAITGGYPNPAFTLPVGYRPQAQLAFSVSGVSLIITAAGVVTPGNAVTYLEQIPQFSVD